MEPRLNKSPSPSCVLLSAQLPQEYHTTGGSQSPWLLLQALRNPANCTPQPRVSGRLHPLQAEGSSILGEPPRRGSELGVPKRLCAEAWLTSPGASTGQYFQDM